MTTFNDLKEYVLSGRSALSGRSGRSGFDRPLPEHRRLRVLYNFVSDTIHIKLYDTIILSIENNGIYHLYSGGHHTVTTKKYINRYLPSGYRLFQKNYKWYLQFADGSIGKFYEGMKVYSNGRPPRVVKGQYLIAI